MDKNRALIAQLKMEYRKGTLSKQQYKTLRGQVFSGNADGAIKGLAKILKLNRA